MSKAPIYVNAKLHSLSENNNIVIFEDNTQGLYNVSKLFSVFTEMKVNEARNNPDYQGEYLDQHLQGIAKGNEFFLTTMGDALGLYQQSGEYWGSKTSFELCLRSCSDVFSTADCTLENYYTGKLEKFTYGDHAQYTAMKYAIYQPSGNDMEAFKAFCIFSLARLYSNLGFLQDFVVAHEMFFDKTAEANNYNGDQYNGFMRICWHEAFVNIDKFVTDIITFDPRLQDYDGFMLRYKSAVEKIKGNIDAKYNNQQPVAPAAPPKKRGWLDRLMNG